MNAEFPGDAESFYRLRDDRTQQCVECTAYQTASCTVTIDDSLLVTPAGLAMLTVSCNLLSRWCRDVAIVLPDSFFGIGRALLAQMHDADPFGNFRVTSSAFRTAASLHIGPLLSGSPKGCVCISSSGWFAAISRTQNAYLSPSNSENLIGAIAAACFGVAEVFKSAVGMPAETFVADGIFDLFAIRRVAEPCSHPELSQREIGNILMVGAGSVASSAAYFMSLIGLAGSLKVVDFDWVKVENFNRSPLFGHANYGQRKADALAEYLKASSIEVSAISTSWSDFVRDRGLDTQYDIWLPLANEEDVRWSMQQNLPPIMIHASTSKNWGVNYGRHWPGIDDCLACRFPNRAIKNALRCSTGPVPIASASVDAALPFLSFFAGLLIVAEIARLQVRPYARMQNYAAFDFNSKLEEIQTWDMKVRPECICQCQRGIAFKRESRYSHFPNEFSQIGIPPSKTAPR